MTCYVQLHAMNDRLWTQIITKRRLKCIDEIPDQAIKYHEPMSGIFCEVIRMFGSTGLLLDAFNNIYQQIIPYMISVLDISISNHLYGYLTCCHFILSKCLGGCCFIICYNECWTAMLWHVAGNFVANWVATLRQKAVTTFVAFGDILKCIRHFVRIRD